MSVATNGKTGIAPVDTTPAEEPRTRRWRLSIERHRDVHAILSGSCFGLSFSTLMFMAMKAMAHC